MAAARKGLENEWQPQLDEADKVIFGPRCVLVYRAGREVCTSIQGWQGGVY